MTEIDQQPPQHLDQLLLRFETDAAAGAEVLDPARAVRALYAGVGGELDDERLLVQETGSTEFYALSLHDATSIAREVRRVRKKAGNLPESSARLDGAPRRQPPPSALAAARGRQQGEGLALVCRVVRDDRRQGPGDQGAGLVPAIL